MARQLVHSIIHIFWRERWTEAGSNLGPSAEQPIALPPGAQLPHNWIATLVIRTATFYTFDREANPCRDTWLTKSENSRRVDLHLFFVNFSPRTSLHERWRSKVKLFRNCEIAHFIFHWRRIKIIILVLGVCLFFLGVLIVKLQSLSESSCWKWVPKCVYCFR